MNERYQELVRLAVEDAAKYSKRRFDITIEENETFALCLTELIVRECAKVIVNGGYWSGGLLGPKRGQAWIQCTPPEIAQMIKEHFGVKE